MSVRRLAPKEQQPANFTFSAENLAWAKQQIAKYPEGRQASAVISILWRATGDRCAVVWEAGSFGVAAMALLTPSPSGVGVAPCTTNLLSTSSGDGSGP